MEGRWAKLTFANSWVVRSVPLAAVCSDQKSTWQSEPMACRAWMHRVHLAFFFSPPFTVAPLPAQHARQTHNALPAAWQA